MELEGAICKTGGMSHADRIARIMIQLDDWQPAIWRRAEVPLTTTLKALYDVIRRRPCRLTTITCSEFRADGKRYAIPDPEWIACATKPVAWHLTVRMRPFRSASCI